MALLWYATQPIASANDILAAQAMQDDLEKMHELLDKTMELVPAV